MAQARAVAGRARRTAAAVRAAHRGCGRRRHGSGKSSLVNALVGAPVAVRRRAASHHGPRDGRGARRRGRRRRCWTGSRCTTASPVARPSDDGLVLLDLPDHDSVRTEHRLEAERLIALRRPDGLGARPAEVRRRGRARAVPALARCAPRRAAGGAQPDRPAQPARGRCRDGRRAPAACRGRPGRGARARGLGADRRGRGRPARGARRGCRPARGPPSRASRPTSSPRRPRILQECSGGIARGAARRPRAASTRSLGRPGWPEWSTRRPARTGSPRTWPPAGRRPGGWAGCAPTRCMRCTCRARRGRRRRRRTTRPDRCRPCRGGRAHLAATRRPGAGRRAAGAIRDWRDRATAGLPDAWVLAARARDATGGSPTSWTRRWRAPPSPGHAARCGGAAVGAVQWLLLAAAVAGLGWLGALAGLDALRLPVVEPPTWGRVPVPTALAVGGLVLGLLGAGLAGWRRRSAPAAARGGRRPPCAQRWPRSRTGSWWLRSRRWPTCWHDAGRRPPRRRTDPARGADEAGAPR